MTGSILSFPNNLSIESVFISKEEFNALFGEGTNKREMIFFTGIILRYSVWLVNLKDNLSKNDWEPIIHIQIKEEESWDYWRTNIGSQIQFQEPTSNHSWRRSQWWKWFECWQGVGDDVVNVRTQPTSTPSLTAFTFFIIQLFSFPKG